MAKTIEAYIRQIVSQLRCSEEEKAEMAEELKDHLLLLKNDYLEEGFTDEEASSKAIQSFGDGDNISKQLQSSISPYYKLLRIGTIALFSMYSVIILWNLLIFRIIDRMLGSFNRYFWVPQGSTGYFNMEVWAMNVNLIPFRNTYKFLTGLDRYNLDIIIHNTLGNILIFIPLGLLLPILFSRFNTIMTVCIGSIVISMSIEVLQFTLRVGRFDIDDILLNTIGGIVGYTVFLVAKLLTRRFRYVMKAS